MWLSSVKLVLTSFLCIITFPILYLQVTKCIQTGELESIHALYTKYVPKRKKFGDAGMKARLHVAAMDHNYSADRDLATTQAGNSRFKLEYSKPAAQYVTKPIKVKKDWSFRKELLVGIADRCLRGNQYLLPK